MNRILILLAMATVPLAGLSQPFHGGVMAGICASQVDGDTYAGYNKLGFQGGVFVTAQLTRLLDARLEIRYASRGAVNPASKDNTGYYKLALNYIDLPLLAEVSIKQFGLVEVGLVPGYMFHAGGRYDEGQLDFQSFKKFDLGTLLGAGFRITPKFSVDVRYSYSIFSIRDLESAGAYYSWFGKLFGRSRGDFNNYLTLGVSYILK